MKTKLTAGLLAAAMMMPAMIPPVAAQDRDGRYDRDSRDGRNDRDYRDSRSDGYDRSNRNGRDYSWRGDSDNRDWNPQDSYRAGNYRERSLGRNDRIYRGRDNRYYCKRNDGTTGLVIGALSGGVLGNVIGGGTLGTLLGAGGGALLGRSVDRGNVKCR